VIGILSGKGGVGKTTFSANLGIALAALGKRTLVIDCNVTTPHLSYYLGARNFSTTLNDVFSGNIDAIYAPLERNGVMFIPASEQFEDLRNVDMRKLRNIIRRIAANGRFDFIVLDSAPGLGREAIGTLQAADELIFVTVPTAPNIIDVVRSHDVASMLGVRKIYLAFNMVRGKDHEMPVHKAEELMSLDVLGSVPFDENIMDATAEGIPIMWYNPNSYACDEFINIAARLANIDLNNFFENNQRFGKAATIPAGVEPKGSGIEPIIDKGYKIISNRTQSGSNLANRVRGRISDTTSGIRNKFKELRER
jgi:septum site-determining protein MinD